MKESTLITSLNQLNNKYNKLLQLTSQNFRQIYMIQTATSMTIEALTNLIISKGVMSMEEVKSFIEEERKKKMQKETGFNEQAMANQPTFEEPDTAPEVE